MIRLFASALLAVGLSQVALAQSSPRQNQPNIQQNQPSTQQNQPSTSAESTQAPQNLPQSLRQKLSSAGFSDVNIVPSSFAITAKDRDGRPVMMRITPNSMFFLTEIPMVSPTTTGTGKGESNETAQQNQPSTSAENTQAPQNVPQSLRQRLSSAGFSDVNIVPSSFLITGRDSGGRPMMMRITPNSMFFLTEIPVVNSSTTGAGMGNTNDSGQSK